MLWMKWLIVVFVLLILLSLGSALVALVRERDEKDARRMLMALSWRIGLSLLLFLLLLWSFKMGWMVPHAISST